MTAAAPSTVERARETAVLTCGRTHLSDGAESITRAMREAEGFRTDGGCGRSFDLADPIQHMRVYRCLECARWLCKPCILAHFGESRHDHPEQGGTRTPSIPCPPVGTAPAAGGQAPNAKTPA